MVASTADAIVPLTNAELAAALDETAELLAAQFANPFRIAAYRQAAQRLRGMETPVAQIEREAGLAGLREIPGVGRSIARSLRQLLHRGKMQRLELLRRRENHQVRLASLPGIGPKLAQRIADVLRIESLEQVYAAAYDGRLEAVPGVGRKRVQLIRECLAARLPFLKRADFPAIRDARRLHTPDAPTVATLLGIDREYRQKAERGQLIRVAPRRFNPTATAWLPILKTERDGRWYRAMYSNTARAHELAHTDDWVVIHRDESAASDETWTVITGQFGRDRGRRIVRGREEECRALYETARQQAPLFPDTPVESWPLRRR